MCYMLIDVSLNLQIGSLSKTNIPPPPPTIAEAQVNVSNVSEGQLQRLTRIRPTLSKERMGMILGKALFPSTPK